ncbi:MAG: hypothetical protein LBK76_02075 [Verrucomicrobiales bacterium]|jgi:hypothetical protein|nr:hypothetical protein [Verrucomicrobiales bacterium]
MNRIFNPFLRLLVMGILAIGHDTTAQQPATFGAELDALKMQAQKIQRYSYTATLDRVASKELIRPDHPEDADYMHQTAMISFNAWDKKVLSDVNFYYKQGKAMLTSGKSSYDGEFWTWYEYHGSVLFISKKKRPPRSYIVSGVFPLALPYGFVNLQNDSCNTNPTFPVDLLNDAGWEYVRQNAVLISSDEQVARFFLAGKDIEISANYLDEVTIDKATKIPIELRRYKAEHGQKEYMTYQLKVIKIKKLERNGKNFFYPQVIEASKYAGPDPGENEKPGTFQYKDTFTVTNLELLETEDIDFSTDPTIAKAIFDVDRQVWISIPK